MSGATSVTGGLPGPDRALLSRGRAAGRARRPRPGRVSSNGGYVELGLLAALGAALIKAETDNVVVARAKSGLPATPDGGDRALRPESTRLALAREAASLLKLHRIIGAVELSLLIVVAAVVDRLTAHADGDPRAHGRRRGRRRAADRAALRQCRRVAEAQVRLSVVVLTMGNRPVELERAVKSALGQTGVDIEVVLVGNGADVPGVLARTTSRSCACRTTSVSRRGRNRGVEACDRRGGRSSWTTTAGTTSPELGAQLAGHVRRRPDAGHRLLPGP